MKTTKERLTLAEKHKNDNAWFKERINSYHAMHYSDRIDANGISAKRRMKVNYDLFNNEIDLNELKYVCKPLGEDSGELPAQMTNKDIISGKIKFMLGTEQKAPFAWNVIAVNSEATTRKEKEEFDRLRDYVISEVTTPVKQRIEAQKYAELNGQEPTPDDIERINQEIEAEMQTQTPDEVRKYMRREHQDPAEAMTAHLLNYHTQELGLRNKFNFAFKHALLSSYCAMYVGVVNDKPAVWNVNSMRFNFDRNPDLECIEDGEYASCEYPFSPSKLIAMFGKELSTKQIDDIYQSWSGGIFPSDDSEDLFAMVEQDQEIYGRNFSTAAHVVWKALRKIGFLTYIDENGNEQETMVDENYKLNKDFGDIKVEWEWLPEVYEGWKILCSNPIYVGCRPVPGQFKDLDNIHYSKLPYYGVIVDNTNSGSTSLTDRLVNYQYFYNIIYFRIELLMASDKGKKILMNIGSIPDSHNMSLEKWQAYADATPYIYFDTSEEGNTYTDANNVAKILDLSLISDIDKYINIAENIKRQAGASVGITDPVEGQIGSNDAVTNTQQTLVQTSHILHSYFDLHNIFKRNVLTALVETSKIAYSGKQPQKLSYVLDDMSVQMFNLDVGLLDASSMGIFIANTAKAEEIKDTLKNLSHAAMQNQTIELSDVLGVLRQDDITSAEEILLAAEDKRKEAEQRAQMEQLKAQEEAEERTREFRREEHEMRIEEIIVKERERRETVLAQAALTGMSFNPELDSDEDGVNDFLEVAKHGLNADVQKSKNQLERDKFNHQKEIDRENIKINKEKIKVDKAKIANQNPKIKP